MLMYATSPSARRRTIGFSLYIFVGLLLPACANPPSQAQASAAGQELGGDLVGPYVGPQLDSGIWKTPLGSSARDATSATLASLAFDPVIPGDGAFRGETGSFTEDPGVVGALAGAAWTFDSSEFGRFILVETPSSATQEQLEAPAATPPGCTTEPASPGAEYDSVTRCHGEGFSLVKLDSTVAAGVEGPQAVSITWLVSAKGASSELRAIAAPNEPVIEMMLMGPAGETTVAELVEVALRLGF